MYRCQHCHVLSKPRIPSHLVSIETRSKTYPIRPEVYKVFEDGKEQKKKKKRADPGGTGIEIVKQLRVCRKCHDLLTIQRE